MRGEDTQRMRQSSSNSLKEDNEDIDEGRRLTLRSATGTAQRASPYHSGD